MLKIHINYKKYVDGEIMAREIKPTPKLDLEDTKEFLEKLEKPISKDEKKFMKDVLKMNIK